MTAANACFRRTIRGGSNIEGRRAVIPAPAGMTDAGIPAPRPLKPESGPGCEIRMSGAERLTPLPRSPHPLPLGEDGVEGVGLHDRGRESAGYLLGETAHLLRANAGMAVVALGVMTLLGVAADLYPDFAGPAGLGTLIASLVLQYEISRAMLVHYHLLDGGAGRRRLWALLGLNIISGLGILVGLILFIVPGAYLFVRWSAAAPALIAEEAGVYDSLERSAAAVEGRFWHVFAAMLVIWMPSVAAILAGAVVVPEDQILVASLTLNIPLNLSLVAGWHLAVAIYAGPQEGRDLAEVFA
jgi:hypothetical protein